MRGVPHIAQELASCLDQLEQRHGRTSYLGSSKARSKQRTSQPTGEFRESLGPVSTSRERLRSVSHSLKYGYGEVRFGIGSSRLRQLRDCVDFASVGGDMVTTVVIVGVIVVFVGLALTAYAIYLTEGRDRTASRRPSVH